MVEKTFYTNVSPRYEPKDFQEEMALRELQDTVKALNDQIRGLAGRGFRVEITQVDETRMGRGYPIPILSAGAARVVF